MDDISEQFMAKEGIIKTINQFQLTIQLKRHSQQVICFNITHSLTEDEYTLQLTDEEVEKKDQFKNIFENSAELFQYFTEHIDKLAVSQQGDVIFSMELFGGKKKVKQFFLKTQKKDLDRLTSLERRQNKTQQKLLKIIEQKDELLSRMTKINENLQKGFKYLEQKIIESEKRQQSIILENERNIFNISQSNIQLREMVQRLQTKLSAIEKPVIKADKPIALASQPIKTDFLEFEPAFNKNFAIQMAGNITTVRHSTTTQSSYIHNYKIMPQSQSRVKVTIKKIPSSWMLIGLCSQQYNGKNTHRGHEILSYFSGGYLYEHDKQRKIGAGYSINDVLEMKVDLRESVFCVDWMKNGTKVDTTKISQSLLGKNLYFVMVSNTLDNQIEISIINDF